MHVVIAPDKFKGSLTAAEAADHLATPFRAAGARVTTVPMADGGEGTVDAALAAGYDAVEVAVTGPLGTQVRAQYAVDAGTGTAVVEMALASGLAMTNGTDLDARNSTSRGTGELIAHALDAGARRVILGVGGSASTDGGAGLMEGLGANLYDASGNRLASGGISLAELGRVDLDALHPAVGQTDFVLAADVNNPLLGETGAAAVYGPQKGATPQTGRNSGNVGAGTASRASRGGDARAPGAARRGGYAAIALLGAHREAVDVVLELTNFAEKVAGADLVITGEGSLDEQSLHGKTPVGVAEAAARAGARTIAVAGRTNLTRDQVRSAGIEDRYQILDIESDPQVAMSAAGPLLEKLGEQIVADYVQ